MCQRPDRAPPPVRAGEGPGEVALAQARRPLDTVTRRGHDWRRRLSTSAIRSPASSPMVSPSGNVPSSAWHQASTTARGHGGRVASNAPKRCTPVEIRAGLPTATRSPADSPPGHGRLHRGSGSPAPAWRHRRGSATRGRAGRRHCAVVIRAHDAEMDDKKTETRPSRRGSSRSPRGSRRHAGTASVCPHLAERAERRSQREPQIDGLFQGGARLREVGTASNARSKNVTAHDTPSVPGRVARPAANRSDPGHAGWRRCSAARPLRAASR